MVAELDHPAALDDADLISMAELQTVLQGLEERLMRRLTPTGQFQEVTGPTVFVSPSELQTSIQNLEERLTQRMQHMLTQTPTPEPVRVGQPVPSAAQLRRWKPESVWQRHLSCSEPVTAGQGIGPALPWS